MDDGTLSIVPSFKDADALPAARASDTATANVFNFFMINPQKIKKVIRLKLCRETKLESLIIFLAQPVPIYNLLIFLVIYYFH
jgi:hypothetical protein